MGRLLRLIVLLAIINNYLMINLIIGPSDVWFGVGFNALLMKDLPYAIIVDGDGHVTERKLSDHGPGHQLMTSVKE